MEENVITNLNVNGEARKIRDEDAARIGDLTDEIVNREAADAQLGAELGQKQDSLTDPQLAAVNSGIDSAKVAQINQNSDNISDLGTELDGVTEKIPEQASAENQLADKSFVNSSVQTATANFRGNWPNFTEVPSDVAQYPADYAGQKTPSTNDYLVVQDASDYPVQEGGAALAGTWRFKYSGEWSVYGKAGWHPEYQVNETPLTSDQLAALNSGITQDAVQKLSTVQANAEPNEIDSISINGTQVTPDANKNVDLSVSLPPISETITILNTDWNELSCSSPYSYQALATLSTTIPVNGAVELVNDQAVLFATHGFAIGAVNTTNNTITIYSIGKPTSSVSLNIKVRS